MHGNQITLKYYIRIFKKATLVSVAKRKQLWLELKELGGSVNL